MIAPVEVSPLIKDSLTYHYKIKIPGKPFENMINVFKQVIIIFLCRYSALVLGIIYGARRYAYLKPIAVQDRIIEAEEKAKRDELKRIAKELEEAQESILK